MQITEINVDKIKVNPNQPRKEFDKESLEELSASIKSRGLINPISVKQIKGTDNFELICGERRLRAFKLANIKKINAIVREYNSKEDEMADSLIENLHRSDLTSVEKENFITKLWKSGKYKTKRELSKAVGLSETYIHNILNAKETREKTFAAKTISTRNIIDVGKMENIQDKKNIFKKLEKGEIKTDKVRKTAKVINKSQDEVKQAYFSNKISIEQADKISNIQDKKTREKMITAHKNIKLIDKSIEKNFDKIKPKNIKQTIRIKEMIDEFRGNAIQNQKITQTTIRSLLKTLPLINLMDTIQLKRLNHFQELFENTISNALQLSENLKEKIKN